MPKEPPRHELRKETFSNEHEGTYKEAERSARAREHSPERDLRNPEKRTARSATRVLEEALQSVTAANNGLAKLYAGPNEGFLDAQGGKDWKAEARACGTDLAGYFNDYKLALEAGRPRSKNPNPEQIRLDRLLDWLELAEQKGGIGDWLAQWNALMKDPYQRNDISRMADIADSIRAGIEFQKALIRELDLLGKEDIQGPPEAKEVLSLLNSIAFEVSRQLGEGLSKHFEAGSKLVVARNTLKRNSDRESRAEAVRQAMENLSVSESLEKWYPESTTLNTLTYLHFRRCLDLVVRDLRQWETAATQLTAIIQTVGTPEYPGQATEKSIAKRLIEQSKMVDTIGEAVGTLTSLNITLPTDGISLFGVEHLLFTLSRIASGILEKQRSFATQLMDRNVKEDLILHASQMATVCAKIEERRKDSRIPQYYEKALTAAKDGRLRGFWSNVRDLILADIKNLEGAGPAGKTALAELDTLFTDNLGGKLDEWSKRQNKPEDIYGLAWQLVATLREYKTSATRILDAWTNSFDFASGNGGRAAFCESNMVALLDSIIGTVAQGLDDDIAVGRG
jgi:hypothetical protein